MRITIKIDTDGIILFVNEEIPIKYISKNNLVMWR